MCKAHSEQYEETKQLQFKLQPRPVGCSIWWRSTIVTGVLVIYAPTLISSALVLRQSSPVVDAVLELDPCDSDDGE
jgi:hypothetical protein